MSMAPRAETQLARDPVSATLNVLDLLDQSLVGPRRLEHPASMVRAFTGSWRLAASGQPTRREQVMKKSGGVSGCCAEHPYDLAEELLEDGASLFSRSSHFPEARRRATLAVLQQLHEEDTIEKWKGSGTRTAASRNR